MSAEPVGTGPVGTPVKLPWATDKTWAVLRVLLNAGEPLGCREIADRGRLNPTTVRSILHRLTGQGLTQQRHPNRITRWSLMAAGQATASQARVRRELRELGLAARSPLPAARGRRAGEPWPWALTNGGRVAASHVLDGPQVPAPHQKDACADAAAEGAR